MLNENLSLCFREVILDFLSHSVWTCPVPLIKRMCDIQPQCWKHNPQWKGLPYIPLHICLPDTPMPQSLRPLLSLRIFLHTSPFPEFNIQSGTVRETEVFFLMCSILFAYLFLAVQGLGCCTPAFVQTRRAGFSLWWGLMLWSAAARAKASGFLHISFAAAQPGESSRTRDQSRVPCFGRWLPTHCAPREVWCRPCVNRPCCIYDNTASAFVLDFWPWGMWDLGSPTRDQTHIPLCWKVKS